MGRLFFAIVLFYLSLSLSYARFRSANVELSSYSYGHGIRLREALSSDDPSISYLRNRYDIRYYNANEPNQINPLIPAISSALIPGLGQMELGFYRRGLMMFSMAILGPAILMIIPFLYLIKPLKYVLSVIAPIGIAIWSSMDAYRLSKYVNMYNSEMNANNRGSNPFASIPGFFHRVRPLGIGMAFKF